MRGEITEGWDVAQICENGHVLNGYAQTHPQRNQKFCSRCGKPTLIACPACHAPIRGKYHHPDVVNATRMQTAPAFCHKCGQPYPWTSERLATARAIVEESALDPESKKLFAENVEDLVSDQPRTQLAAQRVAKILAKLAKPAAAAVRDVLVDIASESVRKIITG